VATRKAAAAMALTTRDCFLRAVKRGAWLLIDEQQTSILFSEYLKRYRLSATLPTKRDSL